MQSRTVVVTNALGMHARASAKFARIAAGFVSRIHVKRDDRTMDGKSILGLLLLAASHGTEITILVEGPDEHEAVTALTRLVEAGFDEP